nr:conjugative transfer relaxase/helicase TraI domain-containing protein [Shigella sonnei]
MKQHVQVYTDNRQGWTEPSGKNIIRWLLKKRTNGSVRYCQYTS